MIIVVPDTDIRLEVLGATEAVALIQRLGWAKFHVNYLSKLEAQGKFPEPWIELSGRKGWLKHQIEDWYAERGEKDRAKAVEQAASIAASMTDKELSVYLKEIERLAKSARS